MMRMHGVSIRSRLTALAIGSAALALLIAIALWIGMRAETGTAVTLGLMGIAIGVAAGLVSIAIELRRELRPIAELLRLSRSIATSKDLSQRVANPANNEIGELCGAFNNLLDELVARSRAVERHRRDVDLVVEARRVVQFEKAVAETEGRKKEAFLNLISHEIRAPLTEIIDATTALFVTHLSPEQCRAVQLARSRAEYLLHMSGDVSALAGSNRGQPAAQHVVFEPCTLIESVVESFAERAHVSNVDLVWHADVSVPRTVRGDHDGIRQILATLVGNAMKGSELGHAVLVTFGVDRAPRQAAPGTIRLRLEVKSVGPGMLDAANAHTTRTHAESGNSVASPFGGGSILLTIAKQQAEALDAQIDSAIIPGSGSTAWITLTVTFDDAHPPQQQIEIRDARVLLIESSRDVREVLAQRIATLGMSVASASGIGVASELLAASAESARPFDCVIVSARGEVDEFESILRAAAGNTVLRNTPLIVLARRHAAIPDTVFELGGGVTILRTPLRNAELLRAIDPMHGKATATLASDHSTGRTIAPPVEGHSIAAHQQTSR
ncbi:MAG: HAMP domain-containing protein [Burkholderiales bacterium]